MADKRTIKGVEIPNVKFTVVRRDDRLRYKAAIYANDVFIATVDMAKSINEIIFTRTLIKYVRSLEAEFNDVE